MADEIPNPSSYMTPAWPIESIPDKDQLYMRVHRMWLRPNNGVSPGVFQDRENMEGMQPGMSTDWEKYSTPTESKNRSKDPTKNGIIRMQAGKIRKVPGQSVEHKPLPENRAHTEVYGDKDDPEVRLKFTRIYEWVIPLDD